MRFVIALSILAGLTVASPHVLPAQSNEEAVEDAKQAAQEWLTLFDDGKYKATWKQASSFFQSKIGAEQWTARITQSKERRPVLDSLQSRSVAAARYTESLPQAPDGEYVVIQYRATYADEKWVDTVTLKKESDAWKVAGYVTKPANR